MPPTGLAEELSKIAGEESKSADYLIYTKELDLVEPMKVGERGRWDESMLKILQDEVDHMVGPLQKDLERAIADDRLIVLNRIARSVIEAQRALRDANPDAEGAEFVFPYEGRAIHRMNDTAWDSACGRAAQKWKEKYGVNPDPLFATLRVHDLKHTFGRRLRAADVTFEDRQALLGHKGKSVTTHYSQAELENLIRAANKVCDQDNRAPTLLILKRRAA